MRLHRLVVSAFGPFAGVETVDLDACAEAGLFLLHGPTGAGKSSLLDSVGYALYGRVPGARQAARQLRSDHAAPDVHTSVELEVTVRGRRFRVTRSPEQPAARRRGTGTRTIPAAVRLAERRAGRWEVLSTRVGEADQVLRAVLGMSAEQFYSVVLLPQGDFARFLRADADEKATLLGQLFGTARFVAVERWLCDRRGETVSALAAAEEEMAKLVARTCQAAGIASDDASVPGEHPHGWLADLQTGWQQAATEASDAEARAGAAVATARAEVSAADDLARRQAKLADAARRAATLAAGAADHERDRRRLAAARRAAPVRPLLDAVAAAEGRHRGARERLLSAVDRLPADLHGEVTVASEAGVEPSALRRAARRRLDEVATLRTLEVVERDTTADRRAEARLRTEVGALDDRIAEAMARSRAESSARLRLQQQEDHGRAAVPSLAGVRAELEILDARLPAARELPAARARRSVAEAAVLAARERAMAAKETWLGLRERRLDEVAAELAEHRLQPGAACPVCGSPEHPAPARPAADAVTPAAEQAAHEVSEELERDLARAYDRLSEAQTAFATLAAVAGTDATADELSARRVAAAERVTSLSAAVGAGETAARQRSLLEDEAARRRQEVEELSGERARRLARAETLAERAAVGDQHLAGAIGDDGSLAARIARLGGEAEAAGGCADAAEEEARAERSLRDAFDAAQAAATAAGFAHVSAARAVVLEAAEQSRLEESLAAVDRERAAVEAVLADPELAGVRLDPPADPAAAGSRLDTAEAALARAQREAHDAARISGELHRLQAEASDLLARTAPLRERAATVSALADLAGGAGANTLRMRLSSYVLAARLEQVAAAATVRLASMSGGRYALAHSDEVRDGRRRSGLDLRVLDAWSGRERHPGTLSGGETFLASLALALGLADVVTAEAGGAGLETLFVDEGFGSLDEEALEEVLDVLDGLRDGGRAVGVVSHVPELRTRIPAHVRVLKGRTGSTVRLAVGAGAGR